MQCLWCDRFGMVEWVLYIFLELIAFRSMSERNVATNNVNNVNNVLFTLTVSVGC